MPFKGIVQYLTVALGGKLQELDLDTHLGNVRGKLRRSGQNFFSSARNLSLKDSVLSDELQQKNKWAKDHTDLGERIYDIDGKPTYVVTKRGAAPTIASSTTTINNKTKFVEELKAFKSSHQSTHSERSSSYFKFSVKSPTLKGSVLNAECRSASHGEYIHSELDLDSYIGVINSKLVWGRKGFYSVCKNIRLYGFTLTADYGSTSSFIDLSRYLQTHGGKLSAKVTFSSAEFSGLFSEAGEMKSDGTAEPAAAAEAFSLLSGERSAFKSAFSALAETTSKQVVEEMTEEFSVDAERFVQSAVSARIREEIQMAKVISQRISRQVKEENISKVKEAFDEAQKGVLVAFAATQQAALDACHAMGKAAAGDCTHEYSTMTKQITAQCKSLVQGMLTDVSESTVAQFQERVEILMEREIVGANFSSCTNTGESP